MFEYESFFHSDQFDFVRGKVSQIDRASQSVIIGDEHISYNVLVLAVGSTSNLYSLKGTEHAYTLKSVEDAIALKRAIISQAQEADRQVRVTVIGGGPTGLELLFDIYQLLGDLKRRRRGDFQLRLIHATDLFCPQGGERVQAYIDRALRSTRIQIHCNTTAREITADSVETTVGTFPSDVTVLCTGVRPNTDFLKDTLVLDSHGHIPVAATLQSVEDPRLFALGDIIAIDGEPVPKLAQTAVTEARVAAHNIVRLLHNPRSALRAYRPRVLGMLFSLGYGTGVGTIGPVLIKGASAWYIWRSIYLFKIPGFWNKLRVAFSWTIGLFQGRNFNEL
jgi:NADH dehydrogenase